MATGINNLPFPGKVYNPFDVLTAEELNEDVANIESLATGAGLGDGAVTALKTSFGGDYTTTEVNTGFKWVDGKDIYKKTVNTGTLPNAGTKNVAHGITGIDLILGIIGFAKAAAITRPIPYSSSNTNYIQVTADATNISIFAPNDLSSYTVSYITIHYTKT